MSDASPLNIAIACGGTGGHLFPGLAVAERLQQRGCAVTLLISPKDVDQHAARAAKGMEIVTLPAVGLTRGGRLAFARGFVRAYRAAKMHFRQHVPEAALAMGGFTGAPPLLAARSFGARTFLHESNTIPGRANRWLSWTVSRAFVGFEEAGPRLHTRCISVTGTPVRPQFQPRPASEARTLLGLDPLRPVLLVMGGSQGASGINQLVIDALASFVKAKPELQLLHLTGTNDLAKVSQACAASGISAVVHPFMSQMELALAAASVAISRAGASSLAELAAMRVPSVLIPFPAATDNHQYHNARAFEKSGAARLLDQKSATPETLLQSVLRLQETAASETMQAALAQWHTPGAAEQIAEIILAECERERERRLKMSSSCGCSCGCHGSRSEAHGKAGA